MTTFAAIVGIIAAIIGVIGVVIAVVVFVRGSYGAARMQALREDNGDLRASLNDADRQKNIDDARIEALTQRVVQLEAEGALLRELSLQHANVDKAIDAIRAHDRDSHAMWQKIIERLDAMENKQ